MILTVKDNCQAFFLMIHYKAAIKARNRWMINRLLLFTRYATTAERMKQRDILN
jgi:hypothetical protein